MKDEVLLNSLIEIAVTQVRNNLDRHNSDEVYFKFEYEKALQNINSSFTEWSASNKIVNEKMKPDFPAVPFEGSYDYVISAIKNLLTMASIAQINFDCNNIK